MLMRHRLVSIALCSVLCSAAAPQAFRAGDVYLYSPGLPGGPGIVRLADPPARVLSVSNTSRNFAYDPHRDKLIVPAELGAAGSAVWAVDPAGSYASLGFRNDPRGVQLVAPTGDGRIYVWQGGPAIPYFDATNTVRELLDVAGTQRFLYFGPGSHVVIDMIYHAPSRALFTAHESRFQQAPCSNSNPEYVCVRKIPLTADGSRVAGPVLSVSFDVQLGPEEMPCGFSHGPDGTLMLVIDTNSNERECRMVLVDPMTLAVSCFAANGPYIGAAATNAGTYSPQSRRALILDTLNDIVRSFERDDQTNQGSIYLNNGVSGSGGSGEWARMISIGGPHGQTGLSFLGLVISLLQGGSQTLSVDAGRRLAGSLYVVLGSMNGWWPGIDLGAAVLPINLDSYTTFPLSFANASPYIGFAGVLDVQGRAQARLVLPPGLDHSLAGSRLYHACAVLDLAAGRFVWASNASPLELTR